MTLRRTLVPGNSLERLKAGIQTMERRSSGVKLAEREGHRYYRKGEIPCGITEFADAVTPFLAFFVGGIHSQQEEHFCISPMMTWYLRHRQQVSKSSTVNVC